MFNNLKAIGFMALSAWACVALQPIEAQEPGYAKLYDQGVNAFFAGGACRADELLSEALTFNSQDPRAYYFRALSLLRQGRVDEARGDMLVGAMVEAQHPQRYAVGTALERVQGCDRLMLEQFRRDARYNAAVQPTAAVAAPVAAPTPTFITPQEQAAGVVREKRIVPLEELLRSTGPQSIPDEAAAAPSTAVSPQGNPPAAKPVEQPAAQPAETPAAPEANPFGDDSEPKSAPAPQTPPQEAPKPAPPASPPATPPAGPDENPFGG